uniref:Uncharacterized protein n=1 Tax=Vitis vinifera TaxID=29760 RepID=A5BQX2_VITVI|nr:hypothetical protein VITISV_038826 [Vitis vinifera]
MDVSLESKSLPSVGNSRKSYLKVTSQRLARGKLVHLLGWRSLALPSVGSGDSKIFSLFTNLKAKESCNWWLTRSILGFRQQKSDVKYLPMSVANIGMLQGPFRKRKWCLRDFADTQEGLRNHFAAKDYSRRAAKLASILRFTAFSLRHISGNFRRKYTILYKKAAKSLRNKRHPVHVLRRGLRGRCDVVSSPPVRRQHHRHRLQLRRRAAASRRAWYQYQANLEQDGIDPKPFSREPESSRGRRFIGTISVLDEFRIVSIARREDTFRYNLGLGYRSRFVLVCCLQHVGWEEWEFGSLQVFEFDWVLYAATGDFIGVFLVCSPRWAGDFRDGGGFCAMVHEGLHQAPGGAGILWR